MFRNGQDVKQATFVHYRSTTFSAIYLQAVADLSKARATQTNANTVYAPRAKACRCPDIEQGGL